MDSDSDSDPPVPDEAWQVAHLTAILVAERLSHVEPHIGLSVKNEAGFENELAAAMRRARRILELSRHPELEIVHLYQVFEEAEEFSETELVTKIHQAGWTSLKESSIRDRLKVIRVNWQQLLKRRRQETGPYTDVVENIQSKLYRCFEDLESTFGISEVVPDFSKWFNEATRALIGKIPFDYRIHEHWDHQWGQEEALYAWCIQEGTEGRTGTASVRLYRPHELFRFTEQFSWFPEEFRKKRRRDLKSDTYIGPPRWTTFLSFEEFQKKGWGFRRVETDGDSTESPS